MGYWSKRTKEQIKTSVNQRDFTGGYKFWPWLWYMRKGYLLGFFGNLLIGWFGGLAALNPENDNPTWLGIGVIGFFGVFAPTLIGFLLRRDYKEGQKGITR